MGGTITCFVSSTFSDLIADRQAAISEVDLIGHAVAMERFGAQPYPALDVCLEELRPVHAVVLLTGSRYGAIVPERGVSYTEAEFEESLARRIPVLAFIKGESSVGDGTFQPLAPDPTTDVDALLRFRERVSDSVVWEAYTRPEELPLLIRRAVEGLQEREGRLDLRGRTLVSTEPYFAPYLSDARAFHHGRPLIGRDSELAALLDAMADRSKRVASISGRGGIGKTRLLLQLARLAAEAGWRVRWVRSDVQVAPDVLAEMPSDDLLLIVDDAHRQRGLETLLRAAASRSHRTFVVLGYRPWARPLLERALADAMVEPSERTDIGVLGELPRKVLMRLVRDELGPALRKYAPMVVDATSDSTLVALVGARLVRTAEVPVALLERVDAFQQTVLARFAEITLGDFQGIVDPTQARRLLELISATGPIGATDPVGATQRKWRSAAAEWIGIRESELVRLLGLLEQGEVLARINGELRVVPDVLADHLLAESTVSPTGEPTGMGAALVEAFGDNILPRLIVNLSELDWRLERSGGSARVLDEVWGRFTLHFRAATNGQRIKLLKVLKPVAATQPGRALDIVEWLEANPHGDSGMRWFSSDDRVLDATSPVAQIAALNPDHADRALDYLWRRARDIRPNGLEKDQGTARDVEAMITYRVQRPVSMNEAGAAAFERWTSEIADPDWPERKQLPFFLVHSLFEKEIVDSRTRRLEVSLRSVPISPVVTSGVRHRIISRCAQLLRHAVPRVRIQAAEALLQGLQAPNASLGREVSQAEEEGWWPLDGAILDAFAEYVRGPGNGDRDARDPLVLIRMKNRLPLIGEHAQVVGKQQRCFALHESIVESREMMLFRAYGELWPDEIDEELSSVRRDQTARQLRAEDGLNEVVAFLLKDAEGAADAPPGSCERARQMAASVLQCLERVDAHFQAGRVGMQPAALYRALASAGDAIEDDFGTALAEGLLNHQSLRWWFAAVVDGLREAHRGAYERLANEALAHEDPTCRQALAAVLGSVIWGQRGFDEGEEQWLELLLDDTDASVRGRALRALNGRGIKRERAVRLLLRARVADEPQLASEFAKVADRLLRTDEAEGLDDNDALALLTKLAHVPRFGDSTVRIDRFLITMAERLPMAVIEFCVGRLDRQYGIASWQHAEAAFGPHGFDAIPPLGWRKVWETLRSSLGAKLARGDALALVRDAAIEASGMHLTELATLFGRIAGSDAETVDSLRAAFENDGPAGERVLSLVAHLPPEFVLDQHACVLETLDRAAAVSPETVDALRQAWLESTHLSEDRMVVRDFGASDPRDVRLRDGATAIASNLDSGTPGRLLYEEIVAGATERLAHDAARRAERERLEGRGESNHDDDDMDASDPAHDDVVEKSW